MRKLLLLPREVMKGKIMEKEEKNEKTGDAEKNAGKIRTSADECNSYVGEIREYVRYSEMLNTYIENMRLDVKKELKDKLYVIKGLTAYAARLFSETVRHDLGRTVSGRIIFRTILEAYINMKYLTHKENEQPDVYSLFLSFGVSRYQKVIDRSASGKLVKRPDAHVRTEELARLVAEAIERNNADTSYGYFRKENIRNKFLAVGEQELYEVFYEYGTSFAHASWAAVSEISDDMPDVIPDMVMIMQKMKACAKASGICD